MICQKVCPANKAVIKWIEPGETFSENETELILSGTARELLPRETVEKLNRQDLMEYYDVLGRNLKALITRSN
ncbi:MAG: hypothetical protein JRF56_06900 [Deltaproteobacteria bacterium]|jgi:hypothetical protein|nr:hypothetical protein [Deltaproteobacteria bacterium]